MCQVTKTTNARKRPTHLLPLTIAAKWFISESREVMSEDSCGNYEHLVTLTATDECGNSVDYQFTITVQDTEAPAFAEALPESMDLVCSDGIPAAEELTALDNCDGLVDVSFLEVVDSSDPCAFIITRTWSAVDCSGNGVRACPDFEHRR